MTDIFGPSFTPKDKNENGVNSEGDAKRFATTVGSAGGHLKFTPYAANETADPNPFWNPDPVDGILPSSPGFVTDVVYHYRGHEVAKLFMYWAALLSIGGVVKRDAWLVDADSRLFTNLYLLIVGESGSGKNTATDFVKLMLDYFDIYVQEATSDPNIPKMKMVDAITSSATRAGLQKAMEPKNKRGGGRTIQLTDANGEPLLRSNRQPVEYFQTSEITIVQEEMSVFLNRQLFLADLLPWLIKMYDPQDRDEQLTSGDGRIELRNTLVNMIGNTTAVALKDTLPSGVQNDGFLSRTLLIYQDYTDHEFYRRKIPQGAPSKDDLKRNLAWIASTTWGAYDLTPEADAWYERWYHEKWVEVRVSGILAGIKSRHKVMVLKLAALIRWQRYERKDRLVHLDDIVDAAKLLEFTISQATPLYMMLLDAKSSDKTLKIEETLRRMGVATRSKLVQTTKVSFDEARYAVQKLYAEGLIHCELFSNGRWNPHEPDGSTKERYLWKGKNRSKYADLIESIAPKKAHPPHINTEEPPDETIQNGHINGTTNQEGHISGQPLQTVRPRSIKKTV